MDFCCVHAVALSVALRLQPWVSLPGSSPESLTQALSLSTLPLGRVDQALGGLTHRHN